MTNFDAIILTVPNDLLRVKSLYYKLAENLPVRNILFVGSKQVGELLPTLNLGHKFDFVDEETLIPFSCVKAAIEKRFDGKEVSRGFVGWYYQQFLKMQYAFLCKDDFYLSWDGDTVPIRPITMFEEDKPYMDFKREYCEDYFKTLETIFPGMRKAIEPSFISEHMLFSVSHMKKLCQELMQASHLTGDTFYERILNAIPPERLNGTAFSEFETYGNYIAFRDPSFYKLRRWTSFRNCGQYFLPDQITEKEMNWLSRDFHALSFEKGHSYIEINNVFKNKEFQQKLSARYILEAIQEDMTEGYKETWD